MGNRRHRDHRQRDVVVPAGRRRGTWLLRACALLTVLLLAACADPWVEGQAAWKAGEWEQALACFEQVPTTHEFYVETRDLLPEARFRAGRAAFEDGRWREAIDGLRRLPEHAPRFQEAQDLIGCSLYHMGEEAFERGDYAEAERLATMVRTQCSHFEEARTLATLARGRANG